MQEPIELTDIKQRVAMAESSLKEAKHYGNSQGQRLSQLLQTIEVKFVRFQSEIEGLRTDQTRATEENRRLRHVLAFILSEAKEAASDGRGVPADELVNWIDVVSETASSSSATLNGAGRKAAGRTFTTLTLHAEDRWTRTKKSGGQRTRSRRRRSGKAFAVVAVLGWLVAAALVADKYYAIATNDAMSEALIRSHSERHSLSQELDRVSAELETVKSRLSKYQSREIRAAGAPSTQP